jgi:PAS domain S-box-containing protein
MRDSAPSSPVWKRRFHALFEHAPVGALLADDRSVYLDANPAACRMFGYAHDEFVGLHASNIVVSDEVAHIEPALDAIHAHRGHERRWRFRRKDGSTFEADVNATIFADGMLLGLVADPSDRESLRTYRAQLAAIVASSAALDRASTLAAIDRDEARERVEAEFARDKLFADTMIESMPGILYFYDADGRFLRWNSNFERVSGYSAAEIAGMHPLQFFKGDDRALVEARITEVFTRGESSVEALFAAKDGTLTPYFFTGRRVMFGGRPCLVGMGIDISARRRAQAQLAESERRYRELVENVNSIILRWTPDGRVAFLNDFGLRFFGFSEPEILGRPVTDTIVPSTDTTGRDLRDLMAQICAAPEQFQQNVNENVRKNGDRVWVAWTNRVVRGAGGDATEILSVGTDDTERRRSDARLRESEARLRAEAAERQQAERRLRESEERFRLTFEQAAVGVAHVALDGSYLWVNDKHCAMFGYTRDEMLRMQFITVTAPEDRDSAEAARLAMLEGREQVYASEKRYLRKDGSQFWANVVVTFVPSGGQPHFVTVVMDITERKQLEEQLRQAQKMEAVGRLAGGVAHDFNNLLTVICGSAEMLQGQPLAAADRDLVQAIADAGTRAAALTRQLLGFSRRTVLQPRVLDLNPIVSHTEQMLRRLLGEDIVIVTRLAPDLQPAKVDPGQLDQILMNLAVNARDAMPGGGRLTIETANVELDHAFAAAHPGGALGPHVMLAIADTGCGMTPDVMAHIFEPFFTTKAVDRGTGLGLSMVLGIVEQSGGTIEVQSEPGRGTTFRIYLPIAREAVQPARTTVRPDTRGSETILLVEDEATVRALVIRMLQQQGYRVVAATDGRDALRVARGHAGPIHLVLTDVVMPHLGGPELLRQLQGDCPGVKALFMSGYTDDAVLRHGLLETKASFLQKPYTPMALAHKIREVLDNTAASG